MLPAERQRRIKELIQLKQFIKISELSKVLGVSEMTIHRDLKPLIEKGIVVKSFGGIALATDYSVQQNGHSADCCVYCLREVSERLAYRLILNNGQVEQACCAHCGLLRHQQIEEQVRYAVCRDFLKQTTISAPLAAYVLNTSIHINCCQPQVLTFELPQHAEMFVKGFGGNVYSFSEASQAIQEKMNSETPTPCCQASKK